MKVYFLTKTPPKNHEDISVRRFTKCYADVKFVNLFSCFSDIYGVAFDLKQKKIHVK